MEVQKLLPDRIGEEVTVNGRRYRIIGDDRHTESPLKKWDYILQNVDDGEIIKVFAEEIQQ